MILDSISKHKKYVLKLIIGLKKMHPKKIILTVSVLFLLYNHNVYDNKVNFDFDLDFNVISQQSDQAKRSVSFCFFVSRHALVFICLLFLT